MQRFRDLIVWQRSHALTLRIYLMTRDFPSHELYGLTAQIRRSAASAPANIAEGSKRRRPADYARFLNVAESSLAETDYHLLLARDLGYVAAEAHAPLEHEIDEICRMLDALRTKVENEV